HFSTVAIGCADAPYLFGGGGAQADFAFEIADEFSRFEGLHRRHFGFGKRDKPRPVIKRVGVNWTTTQPAGALQRSPKIAMNAAADFHQSSRAMRSIRHASRSNC